MSGAVDDLAKKRFMVCLDEVNQNFVFGETFIGAYAKSVTLSNGSIRNIELTPMIRNGMPVVQLKDGGVCTYMGINGTTVNGRLMVQIRDLDAMEAQSRSRSFVLPFGTSLLALPQFVPPEFAQGLELLNDDRTPMQFVVEMLSTHAGLTKEQAHQTMLDVHTRGGALVPTETLDEAQRIAAQITAEAAKHTYPLVCRAVAVPGLG